MVSDILETQSVYVIYCWFYSENLVGPVSTPSSKSLIWAL